MGARIGTSWGTPPLEPKNIPPQESGFYTPPPLAAGGGPIFFLPEMTQKRRNITKIHYFSLQNTNFGPKYVKLAILQLNLL